MKAKAIDPGPFGMVHDFVVTDRSLVIVIPPLVHEPDSGEGALLEDLRWRPELGSRGLVVDKNDFNAQRWYQLTAGFGLPRPHPLPILPKTRGIERACFRSADG